MSDFLWEVYYAALDILRELAAGLIGWALVLIVIGVPIAVIAYFAIKRGLARRGVNLNVQWNSEAPQEPRISVLTAEPKVGVLDQQAIERMKELSRQGAPLEAICREVSPEYDRWDRFEQQAFQSVIQAALRHYSAPSQLKSASSGSGTRPSAR